MIKLWNTKGSVMGKLIDAKEKIFMFSFDEERDKNKVLDGQPWHFDKFIWCLGEPNYDRKMTEVPLSFVPLWARVYDLPLRGRTNEENLRRLSAQLGTFVKVDGAPFLEMERAVRLRFIQDVRKPLKEEVVVGMKTGKYENFKVKYERLPTYCYGCGLLGHGEKDCDEGPYDEGELRFDESLRASPWKVTKTVVDVKTS
ncbi:uncharacterized protein LOC141641755 [Silene latifolia]|uniref:uncharacterized protein LOC141641755 n=1 Tax=Silene latifolia TaxID=37657 RepID=UPI003D77184A